MRGLRKLVWAPLVAVALCAKYSPWYSHASFWNMGRIVRTASSRLAACLPKPCGYCSSPIDRAGLLIRWSQVRVLPGVPGKGVEVRSFPVRVFWTYANGRDYGRDSQMNRDDLQRLKTRVQRLDDSLRKRLIGPRSLEALH